MANEQTVKIPISLEVIDSSVQNIKDILGKMKPDSAGFKQLSKIMDDLVKSSGKIQASFERGFSSNSEIKAAEKEIRNVEAAMESLNKLSGSITFKDLKLDDSQQKTFTKLEQDLNIAKQHYNDLLKSFGSKENSALIQLVDKDLALRSFDEIQTALTSKVHEMESSAQGLQSIFTKLSEQVNKITEAQKNGSYKQGDAIKNIIGEDAYKDYFLDTKRGLAFNGTKFTGKGGAKSAFIEYLKQSFTLTDVDLAEIRNATSAKDLERIFSDESIISGLTNKISTNLGNGNNLVAQLKNLLSQVNSVGSEMSGAGTALDAFKAQIMSSANVSPELAQALTLVISKMQELRGQAGAAGTQLQQFNKQTQMISQIKGMADRFLGLYQIIGFIKKGFHEMTTTIEELDTVMNGISIVTNMSTSDLWNQVDVYSKMAQQYGTSIKGAYEVSRIYYQQGLETRDVMTLTEETLKLSKISGLDYATTTDYMTTALRGFKMEMTDASKVVDVYSNLAANTAVSQQELAEAMTRTASSMESVGATFEQTSAMIATMVAVTRESASNIGSAMKSIASRYGELTKDPKALLDSEGEAMSFNKVDAALKSVGISMQTADHQFRSFTEVILELSDAWNTLDSTQQRYVATQFAGNRQQSRFLALVSNGDLLRQNLQVAENSDDIGTTQALKALDSIETKITQVTNAWQQFYLNIGLEDIWKGALTGITNILNTLNKMPKAFGKFPMAAIGVVTNAITLIRGLINSTIQSVTQTIVQAAGNTGTEIGTNMGNNMKITFRQAIQDVKDQLNILKNEGINKNNIVIDPSAVSKVATIMSNIASLASMFALSMNDGSRAAELTSGWITTAAGALQLVGGILLTVFGGATGKTAGIGMIVSSLSSIVGGVSLIDETTEEKIARLTKEAEALTNVAKQAKSEEKNLETMIKKYHDLEKSQYESEEAAAEFKEMANEIAQQFPSLIISLDDVGNATIDATQLDNVLAEARRRSAQATLEAAQAERAKAETEVEKAQKDVNKERNKLYDSTYNASNTSTFQYNYKNQDAYEALSQAFYIGVVSDENFAIRLGKEVLGRYDIESLEEIKQQFDNGAFGGLVQGYLSSYFDSLEYATYQFNKILEDNQSTPEQIMQASENYVQVFRAKAAIDDSLWEEGNLWKEVFDQAEQWASSNQHLKQTYNALNEAEYEEIRAAVEKDITNSNMPKALETLGKTSVYSKYKTAKPSLSLDMTPDKWYQISGKSVIEHLQSLRNISGVLANWTEEQFDQLDKFLKDTEHYGSTEELKNALSIDFNDLDDDLNNYYKGIADNYRIQTQRMVQTQKKARDPQRTGFLDQLESITDENSQIVNSSLEQQAINGLLQYEKIIAKTANNNTLVNIGAVASSFIDELDGLDRGLADQIIENGFITIEGYEESIKLLENSEDFSKNDIAQNTVNRLKELQKLLPANIDLMLQQQIDTAGATIDEAIEYTNKAISGVFSMEDAKKMLDFFNKYRTEDNRLTENDLEAKNGKIKFKNNKSILETLKSSVELELIDTQDTLNKLNTYLGDNFQDASTFIEDALENNKNEKEFLASLLDATTYAKYFDDSGKQVEGFDKTALEGDIKLAAQNLTEKVKGLNIFTTLFNSLFEAQQTPIWQVIKDIASNPQSISASTHDRLAELKPEWAKKLANGAYNDYYIAYNDLIGILSDENNGLSRSDRNSLLAQAKESERKLSKQVTFGEIIKNFDAISTDAIAQWATAREEDFDELIKLFTQQADGTWRYNGTLQEFINTYSEGDLETEQKALGEALVNEQKVTKDFYSSMVDSITKGEQKIEKTTKNQAIFESLKKAGYDIVEQYGYYIVNLSRSQIQNLITQISEDETLNSSEKTELISSLNNALKTYSFQEIFSDTLINYASLSYEQADKLVKGMSDELGVETSLNKLIEEGILSYNTFTGTYEANLDKLIALYDTLEQLGIDQNQDAANTIRAKILQLQHDTSWTTVVENFISSSGSITYEMIGQLLNAALDNGIEGLDFDTVLSYLTSNGKTFDIKDIDLKGLLEKFGIEDDKQTKIIKDAFNTRINSLVSGYSNLSQQLTSGFSDFSQMQSIVDDLKATGYDIDFESIFRYSDSLHSWVYTQAGILTRIAQLDTQLESIVDKDSQAYKLLEHQRDTLIHQQAQSIDILSVVSATTKEGRDQKRGELLEQVKAYNAVVTDEGKKITAEQLNAIFDGNVAVLKEVYSNLDREVTLDDIRTVANAKYQDLLNAESELDAKVGDIVSERAAHIMQLSGYAVIDKSTQRVTKIDTSKSKQQWLLYQRELYIAGLASLEDLNKSIVEAWGEMYNIGDKSQTLIGALQNANAMSISDLASLVGLSEKQMSAAFLSSQVNNGNISRIGGDQIRINNWNNFMQELFTNYDKAFDTTSEAYISAYSEYLDGQIEQQTKIREQATSLISTLESATAGDLINVFQLDQAIGGNKIAEAAQQAGAQFENGIIKTVNSTNMQQLMSSIAELLFGEGLVNSKELAKIKSQIDTKTTASTAFANIVQNWDNISYEMIETLAEAIQVDILELLTLFESNGHGGYQARGNLGPQSFAAYLDIELDNYSQRIVDNWVNTQIENVKTIANSFVSSISDGKQRINVTEENAELVALLDEKYDEVSKGVGGYFIDLVNVEIDRALQMLEELGLTGNELNEYRAQIFSTFREKSTSNILSQLISNRDNLDSNLVDKAIANEALGLSEALFVYNEFTGELSISLTNLRTALENVNKNKVDPKAYNTLLAQFRQAEFDSTIGIYQQIFTSSTISEDLMAKFINATGDRLKNIQLDKIFSYKDGNYVISDFSEAEKIVKELGLETDRIIADVFKQRIQGFYQNFNTISSQVTSGFNNYNDVKTALEEVNKEFSHFGQILQMNLTPEDFAIYDDNLRAWILTQTGLRAQIQKTVSQLRDSGASWSEIETAERQNLQTFGDQLDFGSLISSLNTPEFDKNYANLMKQIQNYNVIVEEYNKAASIVGKEQKQLIQVADVKNILSGGVKAVETLTNVYKDLGRILTQEEVTAAYQAPISSVIAAKDAMQASVGSVITNAAAALLEAAGYLTAQDLGNGYSVIKSINQSNLQNAYNQLYNKALTSGVATQEQLNELIISSWEATDQGEAAVIEALSKTGGMSYREFSDLLLSQGIELGFNTLNDYLASGAIEKIGNGQIRIVDINKIVSKEYNSQEYQKAYSEFINNEIERVNEVRENTTSTIDKILNGKTGDKINLDPILNKFNGETKNILEQNIGNDLINGILTIHEDSDILQIAATIAQAAQAKGMLLESDIIELGDKIQEAIKSYIDTITQGITNGLTGTQVTNIKKFADTYLGKDFFQKSDFVETAKGFEMTSDAAIRYYEALKKTNSYNTDDMFKQLQERILTRDNINTMSGMIGHIEELGRKIIQASQESAAAAAAGESAKAAAAEKTAAALERELELYKEIASNAQFNDASSYDFMGKSLPEYLQGPLNYWNSLSSMANTFQESTKSGSMGLLDFYNIANELGHLSEITGQELIFFGESFGKGTEGAANLIERGLNNLQNIDGKPAMVNLAGIGINLEAGAASMSASIDDALHKAAQAQINMLDGLIAFLETIVAMESLGGADTDFSGSLEIEELFGDFTSGVAKATEQANLLSKELLKTIDKNKELQKYFKEVKIGEESLYDIVSKMADPKQTFDKETANLYTQILNGLYQASQSNEFTLDNIPSILSRFLVNLDTKVELEDGTVLYYYHGKQYTGDKNTNFSELIRKDSINQLQLDLNGKGKDIKIEADGEKYKVTLKNGVQYILEVGDKGQITATDNEGNSYTGDSFEDIQQQIISEYTAKNTGKSGKQAAIELGFEVGTKITWDVDAETTAAQASEYTKNVIAGLLNKNSKEEVIQQIKNDIGSEEFEAKYGFKLDEKTTSEQIDAFLTALVEQEEIKLNIAEIPGTEVSIVGGVPVTLKVIGVEGAEEHLPYIVGGSSKQNAKSYEAYLSSSSEQQNSILSQIIDQGGVEAAYEFTASALNGYMASVLKEAGISDTDVWELAQSNINDSTSLLQAYYDAVKSLYQQQQEKVSQEDTGENKQEPYESNKNVIDAAVEQAMSSKDLYTKELGQETVDKLWAEAKASAKKDPKLFTNPETIATERFNELIRQALQEKYKEEDEQRRNQEQQQIEQKAKEQATANFNALTQATGFTNFFNSEAGKAVWGEISKKYNLKNLSDIPKNETPENLKNITAELSAAFNEWNSPENKQQRAADEAATSLESVKSAGEGLVSVFSQIANIFGELFGIKEKPPSGDTTTQQPPQTQQQEISQPVNSSDGKKTAVSVLEEIRNIQSEISVKEGQRIALEDSQARQQKKLTELQAQRQAEVGIHTNQKQATSSVDGEIAIAENNLKNTAAGLASIDSQLSSLHTNLDNATASLASMPVADVLSALTTAITGLSGPASSAASAISGTAESLNRLQSRNVTIRVYAEVETKAKGTGNATISVKTSGTDAKGNVALAGGTKTLMGELGPELVVSNGRYFIAGENGAEFVNLADDAIVFNHLQTQRLLKNGSGGRGKAFTNERNATSLATGNVQGPAMASASAVLSQLKQIRAEWASIARLSMADLAGKGGGGGGGGGDKETAAFIRDVERWFNWLQKIADLEKQITYQEQLRSKIQSDMVSSGKAYYTSQKKTFEDAKNSAITSESLYLSQRDYFEQRRAQLNSKASPLSTLYDFDETGQLHFKDKSYEWLANLFKTGDYGNIGLTPKEQYETIIKYNPEFANFMKYDSSGKAINKKDFKKEDEWYVAMVKAFSERMDSEKEEMQNLFDSFNEQRQAVLEQMQAMNEQLQEMKDNQKELEESVLNAIVETRERQIKELEDTKDAIQETNEDFLDGLSKQLDKERKLYDNNQNDQELQRNRRQLAILQRSGASASQIASLQQKIDKQAQDQYFTKQQEQIDAVKEASDLQIERLDHQIELQQEQLEYEKAHGLLWKQVYEVMQQSPENIVEFIIKNTADFWSKSPLDSETSMNELIFQTEQWASFRDDIAMQNAAMGRIDQNLDIFMGAMEQMYGKDAKWEEIKKLSRDRYKEYYGIDNEDPGMTAWDAYLKASAVATPEEKPTIYTPAKENPNSGGSNNGGGGGSGSKKDLTETKEATKLTTGQLTVYHKCNGVTLYTTKVNLAPQTVLVSHYARSFTGYRVSRVSPTTINIAAGGSYTATITYTQQQASITPAKPTVASQFTFAGSNSIANKKTGTPISPYASGGKNDYTGLAMLHGTPTEPEGILNAEDYKAWKQDIKTTNLLYGALASISAVQQNAAKAIGATTTNETGINIENAVVNMNTTIANDYDARRAGEQALEQMLTIARKSGTRSAQRR